MALIDRSLGYIPAQKAWKAGGPQGKKHRIPAETKDNIDSCLSCELPVEACHGCLGGKVGVRPKGRPSQYDPQLLRELLDCGCRQREIARAMGVHESTVSLWIKRFKEANKLSIKEIKYASREEWLELRKGYIGGSEAGAVVGLDQYNSPYSVWAEKTGRAPGFEGNTITRVGSYLEDLVATMFCEETGKQVRRKNRMLVNSAYPWACADVDRMIVGEDAILECKTTNSFPIMKSLRNGSFPDRWYCQMMHYLAVTGKKKAYLAVLVASRDFYWFELERDEAEIEALMTSEQDFWWCVENDSPPETDGSEATTETLQAIYADGFGEDAVSLFGRESLLSERSQLKAQQKALDERIREIENRIKADMGHAEKAACGRFSVSWRAQSRRSFQEKEFRKDHPDIDLNTYYKISTSRAFKITEKEAV